MTHVQAGGHGQGRGQPLVYRGHAVIIVNENFKVNGATDPTLKRDGADADLRNMKALFKALDFKVSPYTDCTGKQMNEILQKACRDPHNMQSQCFVLVISSHGREYKESNRKPDGTEDAPVFCQWLYGSDCKMVRLNDVIKMFSQETTLKEKSKLFFIQACRIKQFNSEEMLDSGVDINVAGSSAASQPSDAGDTIDETLIQLVERFQQKNFDIYTDWHDEPQSSDKGDDSPPPKRRRLCPVDDEKMEVEEEQLDAEPVQPRPETEEPNQPEAANIRRGPQMVPAEPEDAQPDPHVDACAQHTSAQEQMPEPQLVERGTQLIDSRSPEDTEVAEAGSTQPADKRNGNDLTDAQPVPPREQSEPPRQVSVQMTQAVPPEVPPGNAGMARGSVWRKAQTSGRKSDSFGVNTLPDDFLIVYPAMSGKAAFRNADVGSRLLHCMCKMEHVKLLLNGRNILQYLTSVSRDLAATDITYEDRSYKACVCVQHTLCEKLRFQPIRNDSLMANIKANSS